MAKLSNRRRPPYREVRQQILEKASLDFDAVVNIPPSITAGDDVPDTNTNLRTLMMRGWVKAVTP